MTMRFAIVIPHYNHAGTLRRVAEGCLKKNPDVAVFDDGSNISPAPQLAGLPVQFFRFKKHRGKGAVLLEAARWAEQNGFTHIVTLDADAQHRHQDYPSMVRLSRSCPHAIVVGKRKADREHLSPGTRLVWGIWRLWVLLETGKKVEDLQSGYRIYPVDLLNALSLHSEGYEFETEVIVKALRAGAGVRSREITAAYPKSCVSHFRPWHDHLRLLGLHLRLLFSGLLPSSHRRYEPKRKKTRNKPRA